MPHFEFLEVSYCIGLIQPTHLMHEIGRWGVLRTILVQVERIKFQILP